MSVSGLVRVDSGLAYSLAQRNVAPTATQRNILTAAGYPDSLGTAIVFFAERGSETFAGYGMLDTSVHYNVPVFKDLRPWIKFDVYNLFNNQKLIAWSTTVSQNAATRGRQPRPAHRLHAGGDIRQGDRQHGHQPESDGDSDLCADRLRRHQRQRRPHDPRRAGAALLNECLGSLRRGLGANVSPLSPYVLNALQAYKPSESICARCSLPLKST